MHYFLPMLACAAVLLHMPAATAMYPESTEPVTASTDPDYATGRAAVATRDWPSAIAALNRAAKRDNNNADIHNLLGYAQRNNGNFELALQHYGRALALNPQHLRAREYLGELYLKQNNLAKAEEQRAELARLCPGSCEELTELSKKIDDYRKAR